MTPATIIRQAQADGVRLTLSPAGTIKATGDGAAVSRWAPMIRASKAEIIEALKAAHPATAHRWWVIHYPDRDPVEVACYPGATHAEIMERRPDAIAAEPFTPTVRRPASPLSAEDEAAIRAWLAAIDETDPESVADVIERCRQDQDARDYYVGRAAEAR